ncbi:protein-L-isoaspartate O-methyltransferase family protein [Nocardioides pantholopis]|uniref:protein-L-isoaspartate O-methyltransferase family protein n=1 Tax=Nocardioides pantholopis TaxID=2483798 RepID=UPI000F08C97C|nr:protein-L-isoaspartate O-methyltransferase [Nocardioides pantholopis]
MDRVRAAFQATPRADFLPATQRHRAGEDVPVEIGLGMTNSQPRTVAAMLRLLAVRPGDRVLDVGAGSGWTTALLAHLTGAAGSVVGTEIEPALVAFGTLNLSRAGRPWASIQPAAEGTLGDPRRAPYDRILVSAMARELPADLVAQLGPGGILVVPVQGTMVRVRSGPGGPRISEHGAYRFVPLR